MIFAILCGLRGLALGVVGGLIVAGCLGYAVLWLTGWGL